MIGARRLRRHSVFVVVAVVLSLPGCRSHRSTSATAPAPDASANDSACAGRPRVPAPPVWLATGARPQAPAASGVRRKATSIALGDGRGCAVLDDATVACWGNRRRDGETKAARRLEGVRDAAEVAVEWNTAVVAKDGTLFMAEPGARGMSTVDGVSGVRHVALGIADRWCAVHGAGAVTCGFWGHNAGGVPERVKGIDDAVAIDGDEDVCVVRKTGAVACFKNAYSPDRMIAREIPGIAGAKAVRVRGEKVCALLANRRVRCVHFSPRPTARPDELGEADAFDMRGRGHNGGTACLGLGGRVRCQEIRVWDDSKLEPRRHPVSGEFAIPAVRQIAMTDDGEALCALDQEGKVRCAGQNIGGVLGQTDVRWVDRPERVDVPPAVALVAGDPFGDAFTCALTRWGDVHCWGEKTRYDGTAAGGRIERVNGVSNAVRLIASGAYACAFTAAGQATCIEGVAKNGARVAFRVPAFDSASNLLLGSPSRRGSVVVLGSDGAVRAAEVPNDWPVAPPVDWPRTIALSKIDDLPPVKRMAHDGGCVFAEDTTGRMLALVIESGKLIGKPTVVAGVRSPVDFIGNGLVLLPGGDVWNIRDAVRGTPTRSLACSDFVSLVPGPTSCGAPTPCGLTANREIVCESGGGFASFMQDVVGAAGYADQHLCGLKADGAVLCRGQCRAGQCGVRVGLDQSNVPVEIPLP